MSLRPRSVLQRWRATSPLDGACARLEAQNDRTLTWQCDVTRIAAPTGSEAARGAWMAAQFSSVGWHDVVVDAVGNVIARRHHEVERASRSEGAVWCCAHLDTVFSDAAPVVTQHGARLEGAGIGDNGRGLAAVLALADALHACDLRAPREVVFACTVGEEGLGDLRGMKHLMRDASPAPHAVIAIDGAGDDRIVNSALGSTRWRISFAGAGGHSWADFGVANPVHAITALAATLQAVSLPREPRTTLTIARIGGGESINSIPREGWLELDVRSHSDSTLTMLERTLRETVTRIERSENARRAPNTTPLMSTVTLLGTRPSGALADDAALVRIAERATRAIGGHPRLATGSTDASVPIAMGIPAIAIGAGGRGGGTHTHDEWYDDTRGVLGLQRALRIVTAAAGWR
ncbi:MAG: M20/M25/M40 family metallo-hydrolase [Gemmatimonadaceae bacterium]|nr:M20/M25/M40 family metallo-hydrolase [Gemmatimonadaceae bacterium]